MDESAFRELISGERRGLRASVLRGGLSSLSLAYRAAVASRNLRFDRGLSVARAAVPVVSVGNITTGGTGKTPFVALLARWFADRKLPIALLSRGYRTLDGAANDEKLLLDRLCPDVPHLQNPDRVRSASIAAENYGARVLILDDGFQHRRLARDLDIVLVDALNPWGFGRLLPRGLLREPLSSLRRADLVAVTRADQCPPSQIAAIVDRIADIRRHSEHLQVAYPPAALVNGSGATQPLDALRNRPVAAFCGIGNPDGFLKTLDAAGLQVVGCNKFPDHHHYTQHDLEGLSRTAADAKAEAIVTTEKDLVKIDCTHLGECPLWAVRIGAEVIHGRPLLEDRLQAIARLAAER